jgi:cell division transport system permease protein
MILLNVKRVIKSGFVNFWRNSYVSLASVLVMTMTLFMLGLLIFTGATLNSSLQQIKDKVDVNVYFVTTAPEEEILALKRSVESLPEVSYAEYVSRDEALDRFRIRHQNDQLTLQALEELDENPLGANLNIKAKETSQYEGIATFLESETALASGEQPIIDKVNYAQNKAAIDKLSTIVDSLETFGLIITFILIIISIIITFNTIRLAIYTSREEISVMRLVGASNTYIRGPFVFEGIMYGVLSAIITLIIFYPLTIWVTPVTEGFFSNVNLVSYYISNFAEIFFIILGAGVALGAISSYLAVKKYLKR